MANNYINDLEALKISVEIEKRGERFYTLAAKKMDDDDIVSMLMELAEQEREHAKTFQVLYNEAKKDKSNFDDNYLFDPEVSAYLGAMVETSVFPNDEKQDEILESIKGVEDVLRFGIQAEKDSILLYTEMIICSKVPEAKEAFRRLLKEEKKHLVDLQSKLP